MTGLSVIHSSSFLKTSGILEEGLPKLNRIHRHCEDPPVGGDEAILGMQNEVILISGYPLRLLRFTRNDPSVYWNPS